MSDEHHKRSATCERCGNWASACKCECFPVIGELHAHWSSQITGSHFRQFFWDGGMDGLAHVEGSELHLLALCSATIRSGCFREFIRQCKDAYPFIRIWCVINDDLPAILGRYGFHKGHDVDKFGEMQEVWDWRKP